MRAPNGRFLPGHKPSHVSTPPVCVTPEQIRRRASGNDSAKGRKARRASPWNGAPMCDSPNARRRFEKKP